MIQKLPLVILLALAGWQLSAQGPLIRSYAPTAGATGALITIKGNNFSNASAVSFGGTAATSFQVIADTMIQAIVGSGSSGAVRVTTPLGFDDSTGFVFCVSPQVRISASPGASICPGDSIVFTALIDTLPSFLQWRKNDDLVGTNDTFYTARNLMNGDVISCTVTSAATCPTPVSVVSNLIRVTVNSFPILTSTTNPPAICSGSSVDYDPTSSQPNTVFLWSRTLPLGITSNQVNPTGTGNPSEVLTNTTTNTISVIYVYTLTANGCTNPTTFPVVVRVKPRPSLTSNPSPSGVCSGTGFTYTPTSSLTNTTYAWSRAAVAGIPNPASNGTGNISEILTNTNTEPVFVNYSITLTADGCTSAAPATVVLRVNPRPVLTSSISPAAICSGTAFSYIPNSSTSGVLYSWTRAMVSGITNAAGSGTGNPNEVLTNSTANAINVNYSYTLEANGCTSLTPTTVTVSIKPRPTLSSNTSLPALCSGNVFSYTPTSNTPNTIISWSRSLTDGLTATGLSNGQGAISQTLSNNTANPLSLTYNLSLEADGCLNPVTTNLMVTVNSLPMLSSATDTLRLCSGQNVAYTPSSNTVNTSFAWTRAAVSGLAPSSGSGNGSIQETLSHSRPLALVANYVYTLSANGCTNPTTYSVPVKVRPLPTLSSPLRADSICSGNLFSYLPTSATPNTSFEWTRAEVEGILRRPGAATGSPDETLTNITPLSVAVTYRYTLSAEGCTNPTPFDVVVVVKPRPTLLNEEFDNELCSLDTFRFAPQSATPGAIFTWSREAAPGIANPDSSGIGNPAEVLENTSTILRKVVYTYRVSAMGCTNPIEYELEVNVLPLPTLTSPDTGMAICSGSIFNYNPTSATAGTSFEWFRAAVPGIDRAAGRDNDNPGEVLVNTTALPINVIYRFVLEAEGCVNPDTFPVRVRVNPRPTLTSTTTPPAFCSAAPFSYLPQSTTPNATFSWSRPLTPGISNATAMGTGNPNEILINTTANPVEVTYTFAVAANGCTSPTNAAVRVTVNPLPSLSNATTTTTLCSGSTFNFVPTSATANVQFNWSRAAVMGLSNPATTGTNNPAEVLTSTSGVPVTAVYNFTLSANGCTNATTFPVSAVVNPLPSLSSALNAPAICSGTVFNYSPTSNVPSAGFSWTRAAVTNLANAAASGNGNPAETLNNTGAQPITVAYAFTISANGCADTNKTVVNVVVNPLPTLSSPAPQTATCSGQPFVYSPASLVSGTSFSWNRPLQAGIINPAQSGLGAISEVLGNTTSNPVSVTYRYTLSANGCTNPTTFPVVVTINPTPLMVVTDPPARCFPLANLRSTAVTAGSDPNLVFSYWSDAEATQSFAVPQAAGLGTYYIKGELPNTGCFGIRPVTVRMLPTPAARAANKSICSNGSTALAVWNANGVEGATFNWTATYGAVKGGAGRGTGVAFGPLAINEKLSNRTRSPIRVVYTITPVAAGSDACLGPSIRVTVIVDGKRGSCPSARPSAATETVTHNNAPRTTVDVTNPNGQRYVVLAIDNPGEVTGFTLAPYTRPDNSPLDTGRLRNLGNAPATLTFTLAAYSNGPNGLDNNGSGDDIIGTPFTVVVTVSPAPRLWDGEPSSVAPSAPPLAATAPTANQLILGQNAPNPFQEQTLIRYFLPSAGPVQLRVYDLRGALRYQWRGESADGWQELRLQAAELGDSGLLYYTLEAAGQRITKKMVLLRP